MLPLRKYFARQQDPYAGGDLENAQRLGAVLFALQVALIAALSPLSPPTQAFGALGWVAAAVIELGGVAVVLRMHRRGFRNWTELLAVSYGAVAALAITAWLGGGIETPYDRAILIPLLFVAAIQPPRQIFVFLGFMGLAMAAPFLYDGWDPQAAGAAAASLVILSGLSVGLNLMMSGIRAQRLAHARDEAEAREEARIDSLTGLHNRRAFEETLTVEVARARRLELPLTVAMLDIEHFKEVNDRWGHAEGDRCLREVAAALSDNVRQPDLTFRWGGDEFALILTGTAAADAEPVGDRLCERISAACERPDRSPVRIRFAVAELRDGMASSELTELAGLALTGAKLAAATEADPGRDAPAPQTMKATSST